LSELKKFGSLFFNLNITHNLKIVDYTFNQLKQEVLLLILFNFSIISSKTNFTVDTNIKQGTILFVKAILENGNTLKIKFIKI